MRTILSIRGGGIRGIIPCCCLMELESQLGGRTRDHIDFCAGTSTGALLTAGVAAGVAASDMLTVYTERSHEIFTPTGLIADAKRLLEGYMYDPANLHQVLLETLGAGAGLAINDSPIRVMIAATAMNGHNWYFVRDHRPYNAGSTGKVRLVDAATASACAPTYFNHWTIDDLDRQSVTFFDGGTGGTANPAYEACVEAFEYDNNFPVEDTNLVDLGTGYFPGSVDPPKDIVSTISWATNTLVDTSEDFATSAVRRQWPGVANPEGLINPELPGNIGEDDLSAIPLLVKIGKEVAATLDWKKILRQGGQGLDNLAPFLEGKYGAVLEDLQRVLSQHGLTDFAIGSVDFLYRPALFLTAGGCPPGKHPRQKCVNKPGGGVRCTTVCE